MQATYSIPSAVIHADAPISTDAIRSRGTDPIPRNDKPWRSKRIAVDKKRLARQDRQDAEKYARYCRPETAGLLKAARLDVIYHKAVGDCLYYRNAAGHDVRVLDFLGGYGSTLFGHNHPDLHAAAIEHYLSKAPFGVQASIRKGAARLGEKINSMMRARFGCDFVTTLANSGTEAVEAAIKHAEMSQRKQIVALNASLEKEYARFKKGLELGKYSIDTSSFAAVAERLHSLGGTDFDRVVAALQSHNQRVFWTSPTFLALTNSFHGKTSGAVKLTYNKQFRDYFQRIGVQAGFINFDDPESLKRAIDANMLTYLKIAEKQGVLRIVEEQICNVSGLFVEPIQGEGGMIPVPEDFVRMSRELADTYSFPLIFDEIQSGMGRTGRWLCSEKYGITGDYYLLSKSLGGGLAKVGALIIKEKKYDPEFGMVHTSTFAEDEFSSTMALRALELLDTQPQIMQSCVTQGQRLQAGLRGIQDQYPDVIKDIRGEGLMIGIEIHPQKDNGSCILANMSRQHILTALIASYLLHEHGIRVAPTLSCANVIRLEPSAYIGDEAIDTLIEGFQRVSEVIHKQNMYELTRCLIGLEQPHNHGPVKNYRVPAAKDIAETNIKKVGFIGHLVEAEDLKLRDRSYESFSRAEMDQLLRKIYRVLGMIVYERMEVDSITGEKVLLGFLGLCFHSDIIVEHMKNRQLDVLRDKVLECVDYAIENNYTNIGFGGFTSIIMSNCKKVNRDKIGVTTGNSLTAAMGLEAIFQSAQEKNINLDEACFAGVGANGNICSIYSKIMAEHVPELILVGRESREEALEALANDIYLDAIQTLYLGLKMRADSREDFVANLKGIPRVVYHTETMQRVLSQDLSAEQLDQSGVELVNQLRDELCAKPPIRIATDLNAIKDANLILCASNSAEPILKSHMLGEHPTVICDIAVPHDVDNSVLDCEHVSVLMGGS